MNTDIRLNTGFYRNLKTLKLQKRLGFAGIISLQKLWLWTAENCPNGILDGVDTECLALLAEWDGDENEFVDTLLDLKWLEKDQNGCYFLHDWEERNPWASDADSRADKARFSRLAQVAPNAYRELASAGIDRVTKDEYQQILSESQNTQRRKSGENLAKHWRNASETPANAEQNADETLAPSPDPSPTPKPRRFSEEGEISDPRKTTTTARARAKDDDEAGKPPPDDPSPDKMPLSRACELYRTCFAGNHLQIPQVTADKLKTLIARYSRADLEAAFDAAANSGAKSLKYLEATIEGKRQNKEPATKRRAKKGESDNGWRCKDITGHWNPEGRGERGMSRPADSRSSPWGDIGAITTEELDACIDAGLGTGRLSNAPIQPGAG